MNADGGVIVFDNLVQGTTTVGEYAPVSAKPKSFVSENAHGVLCDVNTYEEVRGIASSSAKRILSLLNTGI